MIRLQRQKSGNTSWNLGTTGRAGRVLHQAVQLFLGVLSRVVFFLDTRENTRYYMILRWQRIERF